MIERALCAAGLTAALFWVFERRKDSPPPAAASLRLPLFALLSWCALGWTESVRLFPDAFPSELDPGRAIDLQVGSLLFGAAAFAAARGRRGLAPGAAFGLIAAGLGWCASRWPQLSRAIELCGGRFLSLLTGSLKTAALAVSLAALAAALAREDRRPRARTVVLAIVAAWAGVTFGTEALLARFWGYGPRSLAEAAGVPDNRSSRTLAVAWLYPSRGRAWRVDSRRMSSETTDLSEESLERLEGFLERSRFRGVFAQEALTAVREGRLLWWDEGRALDALMVSVPGRAHPDYRRALELLRAGPVTAERFGRLEQLSAAAGRRVEGFESGPEAHLIFEGFSAAYARFGEEQNAKEWLTRLDGLWAVSDKRIEVGSLEDLREGRVDGSVFLDERPAGSLRVGLFHVWTSSAARTTYYWLSGSRVPDADGRFSFDGLGPGRYVLALLGRPEDLGGAIRRVPGVFEITYERPEVLLDPVRVARASESDGWPLPGLPPPPAMVPEPRVRLGR